MVGDVHTSAIGAMPAGLHSSHHQQEFSLKYSFSGSVLAACGLCTVLLMVFTEYTDHVGPDEVNRYYLFFIQVMAMVFLGIGLLMSFLRRYSFSAICLNFFASSMVFIQAVLCVGTVQQVLWNQTLSKIVLDLPLMIDASFCAAAAMISFAAVVGKATPTQIVWMLFLQTPVYALNQHLVVHTFEALDMGGTIVVHAFGCYYGLAASVALSRHQRDYGESNPKLSSSYISDITSMVATVLLWINWPSFNAALASAAAQFLSIANTVLALLGSTLSAFAVSSYLDGKLSAIAVQNATLAGGVCIGAACTLKMAPGVAFMVGLSAGAISTACFKYLTPYLDLRFGLGDTCGIHSLHGLPAILGALLAGLIAFTQDESFLLHSSSTQMAYQIAAITCTVFISAGAGYMAGWLVSTVNLFASPTLEPDQMFEDGLWFTAAGREKDFVAPVEV
ncbi:Rh-like protein/ammonium transporter [Tribonema minus]|uniref:Rh-like protein/ammonium transporter n=1 Tax=Tribonema minus TaxID=303371 RepID=A0A835ZE10_9STRA|nr:Rh-like protein/ammonium transporter [Tribonema minus]